MTEKQFSDRVRSCATRLYRISYLILGREADCEDAVQETLLRAWRRIGSLRQMEYFETWLIRILINESRRMLKERTRHPMGEIPENLPSVQPPDPMLRDAVLALDARFRVPVILHHLEGYRVDEIAGMLSLPVATVKYRLRRGRELLKIRLGKEE